MFDSHKLALGALLFCGAGEPAARDAVIAEAARRGFAHLEAVDITACEAQAIEINGVGVALAGASPSAARVFASTPARVLAAELDAFDAPIVVAPGLLPFTRVLEGRVWHSTGSLARTANDGAPLVWFGVITAGETPGSLVFEHVGLAKSASDGLWADCSMLPKDELKMRGQPLTPAPIEWAPGAPDFVWPTITAAKPIAREKFVHPEITAGGDRRARVALDQLRTLWINTGTLCNLSCASCYIESTPRNDKLAYITPAEVGAYLDEIARDKLGTREIGFTGGEPFLNAGVIEMMEDALSRGFDVMMLTNAMKPMRRFEEELVALNQRYGARLTMRVSLDHYTARLHELERGPRSWAPAIDGLQWLARNGFRVHVAGRTYSGESESAAREGYRGLFAEIGLAVDAFDPVALVLFPEMDASIDVPEITEACWGILHKSPSDVMCASSRMVVKRKGADAPAVLACTLLAYDERFELGRTLAEASAPVSLNHPHCAKFCVLGGAACSRS